MHTDCTRPVEGSLAVTRVGTSEGRRRKVMFGCSLLIGEFCFNEKGYYTHYVASK